MNETRPAPATPDIARALLDAAAPTLDALAGLPELAGLRADARFAAALSRAVALSPFVAATVQAHPAALAAAWSTGALHHPRLPGQLRAHAVQRCAHAADDAAMERALRHLRAAEMLRIAWRELNALATLDETLEDLSELADVCLDLALAHAERTLHARHGVPRDAHGQPIGVLVLALGKLGGRELNFSSDIDLIYAYRAPGQTDGARALDAQEFFTRVGQALTRLLDAPTADGRVFRVDLRLRPFGSAGPLAADFDTLEHYYQEHGRDWERYALIKARPAAGDIAGGHALLEQLRPFVYRRYVDFGVIDALREMKAGIAAQVRRGGLEDDLKLGAGGIREVEFIGQVHQLIRGGRESALRVRPIRPVLDALGALRILPEADVQALHAAYAFLRRAENAVQMLHDRQTQALPTDPADRLRLAGALGYGDDVPALLADLASHRAAVHTRFAALLGGERAAPAALPWESAPDDAPAGAELARAGFIDGAQALRVLTALRDSHAWRTASAPARSRVATLMPLALARIAGTPAPLEVLARFAVLIEHTCRRSAYVALLAENPAALDHLIGLLAQSPLIADWLTRHPVLLDELLDPRTLYAVPTLDAIRAELAARLSPVAADLERAMDVAREVHHAQMLRTAAAELNADAPAAPALAAIAQAALEAALDLAGTELAQRHGTPPGAALVVGYGRLGSAEMNYTSDLDLVFLHDAPAGAGTNGPRPLAAETYYARLAQRVVHILSANTPAGQLYAVDLRLRPSGQSGPLVSTLPAFVAYQTESAWTWEHQALVRARPVAGSAELGAAFEQARTALLARPRDAVALRADVRDMRARVRAARAQAGDADLKHGPGGLLDAEFIAQFLVLAHAHACPALTAVRDCAGVVHAAAAAGLLTPADAAALAAAHGALSHAQRRHTLCGTDPAAADPGLDAHRAAVRAAWTALLED